MTQYQHYAGKFTVGASCKDFGVGSNTLSLNVGDYYLHGYDGESSTQFMETIQNCIRAIAGQTTTNVSLASNGRTVIALSAAANITFDDTAMATVLGFASAALSSAATHTGTRQPRYVWRPSRGLSDHPGDINSWWEPRSTTKISRSVDGRVYTSQGNLLYDGTYAYSKLPREDVRSAPSDTDPYRPLEKFWEDVVHAGKPIRAYPDRSNNNSTSYKACYWAPEAEGDTIDIGSFGEQVGRTIHPWNGLWDVEFVLMNDA